MKFRITRTSTHSDDSPICPGAVREGVDELGHTIWTKEISTLEELVALACEENEQLIFTPDGIRGYSPEIEIYDTFRE